MKLAMIKKFPYFLRSILSGICIGLGGAIFIKIGGIVGAVMFAFGLLTVIHYKLPLYTGIAGFINLEKVKDYEYMVLALIGNILGCYLLSLLNISEVNGNSIILSRISAGYLQCFLSAIGCGLIMTLIVDAARNGNLLLILFGIPLFILLGFYHSIADAFYMMVADFAIVKNYALSYVTIVMGNFVGCNVPRLLKYAQE